MKIIRLAIPSLSDAGLDSDLSEHFGRAPYYTFIDVSDSGSIVNVTILPVPFEQHGPGDIPNWLKSQGANVVLSLGIGGKAVDFFSQLGIEVVKGVTGKVGEIVDGFVSNNLVTTQWNCDEHKENNGEGHRH